MPTSSSERTNIGQVVCQGRDYATHVAHATKAAHVTPGAHQGREKGRGENKKMI